MTHEINARVMRSAATTLMSLMLMCISVSGSGAYAQSVDQQPVVTCGSSTLTAADLEKLVAPKLARLRTDEYRIKRGAIEEWISQKLVEVAAAQRGVSVPEFLRTEVDERVPAITIDQANAVAEVAPERYARAASAAHENSPECLRWSAKADGDSGWAKLTPPVTRGRRYTVGPLWPICGQEQAILRTESKSHVAAGDIGASCF